MEFWDIIKNLLWIVIGYCLNELFRSIKKTIKKNKHKQNNELLLESFSKQDYSLLSSGIVPLAHGVPTYKPEDITCKVVDNNFFYPIPEKYKKTLSSFGFIQKDSDDYHYVDSDNCLHKSFWGGSVFDRGFYTLIGSTWNEAKKEVSEIANSVAEQLVTDLQKGYIRFNGAMFGVSSFNPNRTQGEERPNMSINFYKTDYFTYNVFTQFYQKHPIKEKRLPTDIVNKLSYPFLSSFGVAIIAVISTNEITTEIVDSDIIIIGKRSHNVIVHQGLLHFTMNEAFSLRDTNHDEPSLGLCAYRGFKEELKWSKNIPGMAPSNIKITDFGFDAVDCEMGTCGYVKLSVIEGKSMDETTELLNNLYKESQDGILETEGFAFVAIKDARAFLEANRDRMSKGFANALDNFLRRFEMKLI